MAGWLVGLSVNYNTIPPFHCSSFSLTQYYSHSKLPPFTIQQTVYIVKTSPHVVPSSSTSFFSYLLWLWYGYMAVYGWNNKNENKMSFF